MPETANIDGINSLIDSERGADVDAEPETISRHDLSNEEETNNMDDAEFGFDFTKIKESLSEWLDTSRWAEIGGPIDLEAKSDCFNNCEFVAPVDLSSWYEELRREDSEGRNDSEKLIDSIESTENATWADSVTSSESARWGEGGRGVDAEQKLDRVNRTESARLWEAQASVEPTIWFDLSWVDNWEFASEIENFSDFIIKFDNANTFESANFDEAERFCDCDNISDWINNFERTKSDNENSPEFESSFDLAKWYES